MKRNTSLTFFDISSDIENLPKNELFRLTGGDSDIAWEDELDPIDIDPPGDDPWDGGGDDDPDPWEWDDRWDDDEGDGGGHDGGNPVPQPEPEPEPKPTPDPVSVEELLECLSNKLGFGEGVDDDFKARVNDSLKAIAETEMGGKLLAALTNADIDITISNSGWHDLHGNTLNMGLFSEDSSAFTPHYQTLTLAHELFHVYQQSGMTDWLPNEISLEVEAKLFEYKVAEAILDKDELVGFLRFFEPDYRADFVAFAESDNRSLTGFNDLIHDFAGQTNGQGIYDGYNATPATSLDNFRIDMVANGSMNDIGCNTN